MSVLLFIVGVFTLWWLVLKWSDDRRSREHSTKIPAQLPPLPNPLIGRKIAFDYTNKHGHLRQFEGTITQTYSNEYGNYFVCEVEPDATELTFRTDNVESLDDYDTGNTYEDADACRWLDRQFWTR